MAKAALEAINGCNMFGDKGSSFSVIYVDIDAHNRNRSIFETLLPRESSSKVLNSHYQGRSLSSLVLSKLLIGPQWLTLFLCTQNTDCSLLPTISWPCFATHDEILYNRTKSKIIRQLKGNYGFKRFLRDGYGTVLEDRKRRFYQQGETRVIYFQNERICF